MSLLLVPFHWLREAACRRVFWLGVPFLLYAWTVTGPFVFDDLHLVLKAERYIRGESERLGLFRFATTQEEWAELRDRGTFPWWSPTTQRIDLFRPLSEWSFYLDMLAFQRNTTGHRLVSLAWFVVAMLCIHRLFVIACRDPVRAGVATFFFGISQTVTQPVTFICNRSDLLVLVGTTVAASAYWSAVEQPRKRLVALSATGFVFALLAKEMAVGLAGVILVHEMIVRRRRIPLGGGRLRGAIACVLLVVAAAYVGHYVATRPWYFGLGGHDSVSSVSIMARVPRAIPLYLAVWTVGFPISVLLQAGAATVVAVAAVGLTSAAIVVRYLARSVRGDRTAVFFIAWAVTFMLIGLTTITETRVLCVATVGWAYLLAGLLVPSEGATTVAPIWLRHWLLAANGAISLCCAIGTAVLQARFEQEARQCVRAYLTSLDAPIQDGDTLIVAEARSGLDLIFAGDRLEFMTGRRNVGVAYLTPPGTEASIHRRDDHTLVVRSSGKGLLESPLCDLMLGEDWKRRPGCIFELRDFTVEIGAVSGDAKVTSLIMRFKEPLTSPRLHFSPCDLAAIARGESSSADAGTVPAPDDDEP
ncbi:MAG: hypothetical protein JXQ75_10100 [Phycisphaerae bacterium]|nr:hypothetical protein [Phycisphaerae bacterium]